MMNRMLASAAVTLALSGAVFAQQGSPGAHFVQTWDQNGDGSVSLEEAQTRRGDLFTSFDTNGDDRLSPEEFGAMDEMRAAEQEDMREEMGGMGMGKGMGMMGADGGMMHDMLDASGDGAMSRDEFVGGTADWFTMMDRNGDGQVTEDDFGR